MITTISTCGWSSRTSMWRIVVVRIGGAETIASRSVTSRERQRHPAGRLDLGRAGGQHAVDVVAVPGVGRHPPGRRVRVRQQPQLLQHRELVADRRRAGGDVRIGGERLGADGLAGGGEAVDHLGEQQLLAGGEHPSNSRRGVPRQRRGG
jgi:hypothetical protein